MSNNWKVEGQYFESCTCDLVCPCIFLKPPTQVYCKALVGWQIKEGHMDDTDLAGLNVGLWIHAPGLLTDGNWKAALYIDESASDEQKSAIETIWGGKAGGHLAVVASLIGELAGVYSTKVEINYGDKEKSMKIGSHGEVKVKALEGADGNQVTVCNNPLAVAPGFDIVVHESEHVKYDHVENFDCSGTVGLASPFLYQPD